MKTDLYCIKHQKMVLAETDSFGRLFHYHTTQVNNSPDPGTRYDLGVCEFPDGIATCPPPEFYFVDGVVGAMEQDEAAIVKLVEEKVCEV